MSRVTNGRGEGAPVRQLTVEHLPNALYRKVYMARIVATWAFTVGVFIMVCSILFLPALPVLLPSVFALLFILFAIPIITGRARGPLATSGYGATTIAFGKIIPATLLFASGPGIFFMMMLGDRRPGQIDLSSLFVYFGYVNILFVVLVLLLLHLSGTTGVAIDSWQRTMAKRHGTSPRVRRPESAAGRVLGVLTHVFLSVVALLLLYVAVLSISSRQHVPRTMPQADMIPYEDSSLSQ